MPVIASRPNPALRELNVYGIKGLGDADITGQFGEGVYVIYDRGLTDLKASTKPSLFKERL